MTVIRQATLDDIPALETLAQAAGIQHEAGYFDKCLQLQADGERQVWITAAAAETPFLGYVQLNLNPVYAPFRRLEIPEIQDLRVDQGHRRQGIGGSLVDACEAAARRAGKIDIGLGVGLTAAAAPALELYLRRGYLPNGLGVAYDEQAITPGALRAVDDLLTLKLIKQL